MLTFIRGKARKSIYMDYILRSTKNRVLVVYDHHFPAALLEETEFMQIERRQGTDDNLDKFETDIWSVIEEILIKSKYKNVFLYGNFSLQESKALQNIYLKVDKRLSLFATVQDEKVPDGQIVIEEIR